MMHNVTYHTVGNDVPVVPPVTHCTALLYRRGDVSTPTGEHSSPLLDSPTLKRKNTWN